MCRPSRSFVFVFMAGLSAGAAGAAVAGRWFSTTGMEGGVNAAGEEVAKASANGGEASAFEAAPASPARSSPPGEDLREKIRASVAAVLAEQRRGQELDMLLDELEAQARKQGKVTALEVRTGLAALDAAYPNDPDKGAAFARRMESLSRELEARAGTPGTPSPSVSVLAHLQAIESSAPGPARDRMTREALDAIDRLPVDEQEKALAGLDRATAKGAVPAAPADPERILADLRQSPGGTSRRGLVEELLRAIADLPVEEQERRLRELDAATAAPGAGGR